MGKSRSVLPCPEQTWLLEIPNKKIWDSFVKLVPVLELVRLNLKFDKDTRWRWISGEYLNQNIKTTSNYSYEEFGCLKNNLFYKDHSPRLHFFLCQNCSDVRDPSCIEIVDNKKRKWYEAMNYCVEKNKTLVVFEDNKVPQELLNRLNVNECYWIGLTEYFFFWPHYNETLLYSVWENSQLPTYIQNMCLSVVNSYYWAYQFCSIEMNTVCMKKQTKTTPKTTEEITKTSSTQTSNNQETTDSKTQDSTNSIFITNSTEEVNSSSRAKDIAIGVGYSIIFIFLILFIGLIIFTLCKNKKVKNRKSTKTTETHLERESNKYNNGRETLSSNNDIYYTYVSKRKDRVKTMFPSNAENSQGV